MCNGRFFKSSTRYVQHALMFPRVIETPAAVFRSTSTSDEDSSRSRPGLPYSVIINFQNSAKRACRRHGP
ncbi:hypothetical protein Hanom_Chr03g00221931 [Helianthus anomalus]